MVTITDPHCIPFLGVGILALLIHLSTTTSSSCRQMAGVRSSCSQVSCSIVHFLCVPISPVVKISPCALWRNSSLRWMLLSAFEGREKSVNRKLG
ncbi:hypothetical protein EI94DRAFT_1722467 [Lactarius quietus]|nr:hypothetical protein EI94DRAFT_1722467 [Lactarius quietus]